MANSTVCALSAALSGKVDTPAGVQQQGSYPTSPAVLMQEPPRMETWLVSSERPAAGTGDPDGAIAWQCAALTGRRFRILPFMR